VEYPLSDYLIFEFYTYFISEEMGETIRFLEQSELEKVAGISIPDLVLFDDVALFQYQYSGEELNGGYYIRDSNEIRLVGELMERLFSRAKPFTEIMPANPTIISLLKESPPDGLS
jgi:hypothetical protein